MRQATEAIAPIARQISTIDPAVQKQLQQLSQIKFPKSFTDQYSEIFKVGDILKSAVNASRNSQSAKTDKQDAQPTDNVETDEEFSELVRSIPDSSSFKETTLFLHLYMAWMGNLVRDPKTIQACAWLAFVFGVLSNYSGNKHLGTASQVFNLLLVILPKGP